MTPEKALELKLRLERYYEYYLEQTLIINEINKRGFIKRIIAKITGEYGIAKTLATHYNEVIYLTLKELKGA